MKKRERKAALAEAERRIEWAKRKLSAPQRPESSTAARQAWRILDHGDSRLVGLPVQNEPDAESDRGGGRTSTPLKGGGPLDFGQHGAASTPTALGNEPHSLPICYGCGQEVAAVDRHHMGVGHTLCSDAPND